MAVLIKSYKISSKWEGRSYLGLELDWGYENREMHLSMIVYVIDTLKCFNNEKPRRLQDQTYPHVKPNYRAKAQYTEQDDT